MMTFWATLETGPTLVKTTALAPFGKLFGQTWATFYFDIWSHWSK